MNDRALTLNLLAIGFLLATVQICYSQGTLTPAPSPDPKAMPAPQAAPAPQNTPAPPPAPTPIPFDDALLHAANELFSKA
ncbi:MAG TPA: hypothetical protein VF396_18040, partial [Bradyrhizobium sp.]